MPDRAAAGVRAADTKGCVVRSIDPLLLAAVRVSTFDGPRGLTNASGFFFRRDERLYLVSSRHVFIDEASGHHPDRIELELHGDEDNLADSIALSVLLYRNGRARWRQGRDAGSEIDVAVLEIDESDLPNAVALAAFTPDHLPGAADPVVLGQALLIPGFPLGFHDALHHLPVVRQGIVASPYGWRFQGKGWFLTDARTHRGISGAPVVMRAADRRPLRWLLLGIHSTRLDMGNRDLIADESLGLNAAWYPDILMTLTRPDGEEHEQDARGERAEPGARAPLG
ncbi:MAG: trypsin-like peptidase domain-containing protein [Burkholderiales bacterium]|nr:trypsin-like peptidase domain-containing protein [Burkholderiales bacterium]